MDGFYFAVAMLTTSSIPAFGLVLEDPRPKVFTHRDLRRALVSLSQQDKARKHVGHEGRATGV